MAPMTTEVDRNAEPDPEGSVPTPSSTPLRDGQPQVETEDVELPTVQFDAEVPQLMRIHRSCRRRLNMFQCPRTTMY